MPRELFSSCVISTALPLALSLTRAPFLLKVLLRRFRLRLLRGACEERISINAHDSAPAHPPRRGPAFVPRARRNGREDEKLRRFTILLSAPDADVNGHLRRHALTANHE